MKIEKLPSGSYRVRKTINGTTYSFVFDKKPTNSDIQKKISDVIINGPIDKNHSLFKDAAERYICMKEHVLSITTIREYRATIKRIPEWFLLIPLCDIDQVSINKLVNELSVGRSPKTVRNYHGFISAVLGTFKPSMHISTVLPQKRKYEPYTPSEDDIRIILEHEKDTEYYIPYVLACHGLRRGEILAINPETDIEEDVLHINKSLAMNEKKEWVVKSTKTVSSDRDIIIPLEIANKIKEQGYVFNGHPNTLTCHLDDVQKALGIPHFSIHKMRHYFASVLSANGVPDADIMALGGWRTDFVMKNVYRHSMLIREEEKKRAAMTKLQSTLS